MVCATPSYYLTNGMALVVRPCQREAGHSEGWQSHATEGWQGADATSKTPLSIVLQHAMLCVLFSFAAVSEKSSRALGSGACDRATNTAQHAPRTPCTTRPGGVD